MRYRQQTPILANTCLSLKRPRSLPCLNPVREAVRDRRNPSHRIKSGLSYGRKATISPPADVSLGSWPRVPEFGAMLAHSRRRLRLCDESEDNAKAQLPGGLG